MNITGDISSGPNICEICQVNHGFSSADQRAIIAMVILTAIPLILCYVIVLWFSIRTRYKSPEKIILIPEDKYTNPVYDNNEVQSEGVEENMANAIPMQPIQLTTENERERY